MKTETPTSAALLFSLNRANAAKLARELVAVLGLSEEVIPVTVQLRGETVTIGTNNGLPQATGALRKALVELEEEVSA
jgi:hypothetical protein